MKLGNTKISTKVFGVIGGLAMVAGVIAFFGVRSLSQMDTAAGVMAAADADALLGARMTRSVVAMNRAEFRIAADPSAENVAATKRDLKQEQEKFRQLLAKAEANAGVERKAALSKVQSDYDDYQTSIDQMLTAATSHGDIKISEAQQALLREVLKGKQVATRLDDAVRKYDELNAAKSRHEMAQMGQTYDFTSGLLLLLAAIGIAVGLALGWLVSQFGIVKPIRATVACLTRLAKGELEIDIFGIDRKDEVGEIAKTMEVFKATAIEAKRLAEEQEKNRVAQEAEKERQRQAEEKLRLEREAEKERQREAEEKVRAEREAEKEAQRQAQEKRAMRLDQLMAEFDRKVKGVLETVTAASTELEATASSMTATAEETSRQSTTVAAASEQASANVQTVASAAEELSSSIGEIGRQVTQSTSIASKAVEEANRTNATVKGLADAAQKIGQVVELINTIAGQTNLLALNATIEAARAGDAGKGFAVVASEVKALANQTGKATEEIGAQITGMQQVTEDVVQAIGGISGTITEISQIATAIASAIEEQGAATQEIARNVQQAAAGTHEVSANIGGVTEAAQQTGAAASQVLGSATELSKQSAHLRGEVDQFLAAVKAA